MVLIVLCRLIQKVLNHAANYLLRKKLQITDYWENLDQQGNTPNLNNQILVQNIGRGINQNLSILIDNNLVSSKCLGVNAPLTEERLSETLMEY